MVADLEKQYVVAILQLAFEASRGAKMRAGTTVLICL